MSFLRGGHGRGGFQETSRSDAGARPCLGTRDAALGYWEARSTFFRLLSLPNVSFDLTLGTIG